MLAVMKQSWPTPTLLSTRRRLCTALFLGGMLGACSTITPTPSGPVLSDPDQPLHLTGRFSITEKQSLPEPRSVNNTGRFRLDREQGRLSVEIYSPFGQTMARAGQSPGETAWLETARHQRYTGDDLDQILQDALGIPVPVSRLPNWLSDRFETVIERSADGQQVRAREGRWQIERDAQRWFLVWPQNDRRIEIRLLIDP